MCVDTQEATPAAASTAKPQAEGTVGPETAEVVPVSGEDVDEIGYDMIRKHG